MWNGMIIIIIMMMITLRGEKKAFQQMGFNLPTMQQTGGDVRLLQGPQPLITPLCEQAPPPMEGRVHPPRTPFPWHAHSTREGHKKEHGKKSSGAQSGTGHSASLASSALVKADCPRALQSDGLCEGSNTIMSCLQKKRGASFMFDPSGNAYL